MDYLQFEQWLKQQFPFINEMQISKLLTYEQLLISWNEKINLMSRADGLDILEKHFVDSLLFALPYEFQTCSLLDLGSGAGFPGIPLKILYPELTVYLLEPTKKRANFLELVTKTLELNKVNVISERAEDYVMTTRDMFDLVVARAVAPLNILLEISVPLLKVSGSLMAFKGAHADQEIIDANVAIEELNVKLVNHQRTILPILGHERHLLTFQKKMLTSNRYPRPYAEIKRKPL